MLKTIIFDFDGTIADTAPIVAKAINAHAARLKYRPIKDFTALRGRHAFAVITQELGIPSWKIPYLFWKGKQLLQQDIKKAQLFPGMAQVIPQLLKRYKVVILTSNRKDTVEAVLRRHSLSVSVVSGSLFRKDRSLRRLLRSLKKSPAEVLYVGDELRDADACRRAGVRMMGVSWGYNSMEALQQAGVGKIAKAPRDIVSFLTAEEKALAAYRKRIDLVDRKIIAFLAKRLRIVEELGNLKKLHSLPLEDPHRERQLQNLWEKEFQRWGYEEGTPLLKAVLQMSKRVLKK